MCVWVDLCGFMMVCQLEGTALMKKGLVNLLMWNYQPAMVKPCHLCSMLRGGQVLWSFKHCHQLFQLFQYFL